jgi:hypothetical protein
MRFPVNERNVVFRSGGPMVAKPEGNVTVHSDCGNSLASIEAGLLKTTLSNRPAPF